MSKQPEMVIARNPRATRNNDTTLNLATKIDRSVNLDKERFQRLILKVFAAQIAADNVCRWRRGIGGSISPVLPPHSPASAIHLPTGWRVSVRTAVYAVQNIPHYRACRFSAECR